MRLYLDTSIIGALFDVEIPQRIKSTRILIKSIVQGIHKGVISKADLLEIYDKEGFIRKGARLDLRHIAVATVHGVDAVVSWNFRDIVRRGEQFTR